MTDYSKLKARHPKAKVGNIKKLINAIRRSETALAPVVMRRRAVRDEHVERIPLGGRFLRRAKGGARPSANVSGRGKDRVGFVMSEWITVFKSEHECGTCACIAGFAWLLGDGGNAAPGPDVDFVEYLGNFIGIDESVDDRALLVRLTMARPGVRPRHVVSLLERFLETGNLDWGFAMGINPRTGDLFARERRERAKEGREIIALTEAADAA